MAEVSFARTFLGTLDTRPVKLPADHVEDPRCYPSRNPFILPRMPKPMSKPTTLAPGQERSVTVTLKSLRNPPLDIKLASQPINTSILDVKTHVATQARIPIDKLKILHNKRPVQDSKILKELLASEGDTAIEFSVMVIGGAASVLPDDDEKTGSSGAVAGNNVTHAHGSTAAAAGAMLETTQFWSDLQGFLAQRLKDEDVAKELAQQFKTTWQASRASS